MRPTVCYLTPALQMADFSHPDDLEMLGTAVRECMQGSHRLLVSHRNVTGNGSIIWCETAGWFEAETNLFYLVCRDVQPRKKMEALLRGFTVSTSADLREPANSILIIASLLEQRESITQNEDALFLVRAIRSSCSMLLGIVTNVLTAKELETGGLELNSVVFSPHKALSDIVQVCRLGCAAKDIVLESEGLPPLLRGDVHRLSQIVQNLITNAGTCEQYLKQRLRSPLSAVKFGGEAPVTVAAAVEPSEPGSPVSTIGAAGPACPAPQKVRLAITVCDKGRGMSPSEAKGCFDPYKHAPHEVGGGTGCVASALL